MEFLSSAAQLFTPENLLWLTIGATVGVVLGALPGDEKWVRACDAAGCPVVEMAAIPPGVTGMRLGHLFNEALRREGVTCVENTLI